MWEYRSLAFVAGLCLLLGLAASTAFGDSTALPVATSGLEQWAGIVDKALAFNGRSQEEALQALTTFQADLLANVAKKVRNFFGSLQLVFKAMSRSAGGSTFTCA